MTAITRQMLEWLEMPNDSVSEVWGRIDAQVDVYQMRNGILTPVRLGFAENVWKVMPPFNYLKPDVSKGDLLSPETQWEDKMRRWYEVIWRVNDSARMENHVDAIRNALVMVMKNDKGELETRYFPEGNIPKDTWEEWNALLDR